MPRTALVTGATSGIGRALCLELASRGAHVALAARREGELERAVHDIESRGGRALPLVLDVTDAAAVEDAVKRADRELGSLDLVVANAGDGTTGHASTLRWEDVARVIDVNMKGAMATLVAAIPVMLAQQGGHLVGVSSLAGRRGLPQSGAYGASKAALSTFLDQGHRCAPRLRRDPDDGRHRSPHAAPVAARSRRARHRRSPRARPGGHRLPLAAGDAHRPLAPPAGVDLRPRHARRTRVTRARLVQLVARDESL
jgi:NADP-dependent 3-hydroxy acid dehydrogenase YdfG